MANNARGAQRPQSRLLAEIPAEEILFPEPKMFRLDDVNSTVFEIYPLPDSAAMHLTEAFQAVGGLLDGVAAVIADGAQLESFDRDGLTREILRMLPSLSSKLVPLIPQIARLLIPAQTQIIAAALRKPEEWVANNVPLYKKAECLLLIIEAERLDVVLKNYLAAVTMFLPKPPPQQAIKASA